MERVIERIEKTIRNAISEAEGEHKVDITWEVSFDFLPDPTVPEELQASKLIPALGIYLEVEGPGPDQVTTNSFYYPPYLIDAVELTSTIRKAVDNIVTTRDAEGNAALAALKTEDSQVKPSRQAPSRKR